MLRQAAGLSHSVNCRRPDLLPSRALRNRSRRVRNRKLSRALPAQPHQYAGRVDPKKWRHLTGHFYCFITLQTLQSLDVKHAVINFAISPAVAMDALALKKVLPLHRGSLLSRRTARVGSICKSSGNPALRIGGGELGKGKAAERH
jgi:hypothetical protein